MEHEDREERVEREVERLEREAERMERESERVGSEIDEARREWEGKQDDDSVPGAQPQSDAAATEDPAEPARDGAGEDG